MTKKTEQDAQTTTPDGNLIEKFPDGVKIKTLPTKIDDRGSLCELYNPDWEIFEGQMAYAYMVTIRPGKIKGWALHKNHMDRYFVYTGEMQVVLYDDRKDSPTFQMVSECVLSEYNRRILTIPPGIWHADYNIGSKEIILVNMPDQPYNHEKPDKFRLPIINDYIPYKFKTGPGW